MSILVTERWSPPKLTFGANGIRANRIFDVTGVSTETAAIAAVVAFDPTTTYNATHPLSTLMYVDGQDTACPGFNVWEVTIGYSSTPAGRHPDPTSPLAEPYRYSFQWGTRTDGCDSDTFGNPIINTAGEPFATDPPADFMDGFLNVERNEPFYNVFQALQFTNAVNNSNVTFGGTYSLLQGQACCRSIVPVSTITRASVYVTVRYTIELRPGLIRDSDGYYDAFKLRILNVGRRGWFNNSGTPKKGPIVQTLSGQPPQNVGEDVLLNASGVAFDTAYVIGTGGAGGAATAGFITSPTLMPTGSIVETTRDIAGTPIVSYVKYFPKGIQLRDLGILGL